MLVDRGDFHGLIFDRLVEEHREILAMLDAALALAEDEAVARRASFIRVARIIRIHARAEEEVVFPALDGSRELGHHVRADAADHRAIDDLLRAIERSSSSEPGWRDAVSALRGAMLCHFADEEKVVFPKARAVVSDWNAQELLYVYEQECAFLAKKTA